MDIDKCKILLEVVECGSLSAAAQKLGYTTAGISYNVDAVENELGFPILRRGHAGISLTMNGERILPTLRNLINVNRDLEERAFELRKEINGEVRIGAFSGIAMRLLPKVIRRFQKEFPDVTIKILEGQQEQLDSMLEKSEVDFCICSYQRNYPFQWIPLMEDSMVCVVPQDHSFAKQNYVNPQALKGQSIIMPASGHDPEAMTVIERYGVQPDIKFTTLETSTAFAMVEHGFGIVITNQQTTPDRVKGAAIVPFDPPQYITEGIYVHSYMDASPLVKHMIDYLTEYFKEMKEKEENGKSVRH